MSKEKVTDEIVEEVKDDGTTEVVEKKPRKHIPWKKIVVAGLKMVLGIGAVGVAAKMIVDLKDGIGSDDEDELEDTDVEESEDSETIE